MSDPSQGRNRRTRLRRSARKSSSINSIGIALWSAWCAGGVAIGGGVAGALAGFAIGLVANPHAVYRKLAQIRGGGR